MIRKFSSFVYLKEHHWGYVVQVRTLSRITIALSFLVSFGAAAFLAIPQSSGALIPPWNSSWSNGLVSYWQRDAGMPSNDFASVSFDSNSMVIYGGTWYSGVVGLNLSSMQISLWNQSTGLLSDRVQALEVDPSRNRVFVGTDQGIQVINLTGNIVESVCGDSSLYIWDLHLPMGSTRLYGATSKGLLICDLTSGTYVLVNSTTGLPSDSVRSVRADLFRERVYLGVTPGVSIYHESNGTVINLSMSDGLPSPKVNSIELGPSGNLIFLGTSAEGGSYAGGLSILNTSTLQFTNFDTGDGLTYSEVDDSAYNPVTNLLYLSVRPEGPTNLAYPVNSVIDFFRLDDLTVSHVTTNEGLPGGIIWDIAYDETNNLVLMAADEKFGELTGPVGGGIVVLDPSAPDLRDETSPVAERGQSISLMATAADSNGITLVWAIYVDLMGVEEQINLSLTPGDIYKGAIPAQSFEGKVRYRIAAQDAQGHIAMQPSFNEWHEISVEDTIPPRLLNFGPQGNAVSIDSKILLSFTEGMNPQFMEMSVSVVPDIQVAAVTFDGTTLRIQPSSLAYSSHYLVTVEAVVTDLYGNLLDGDGDGEPGGDFLWSFVTIDRPTPPAIRATAPSAVKVGEPIPVQVFAEDKDAIAWVSVSYRNVAGATLEIPMSFIGSRGNEELWMAEIPAQSISGNVYFHVTAQDTKGATATYPSEGNFSVQVKEVDSPGMPDFLLWMGVLVIGLLAAGLAAVLLMRKRKSKG